MLLLGCDFTSSPTRRKPHVLASGALSTDGKSVELKGLKRLFSHDALLTALTANPRWVGGFDMPFGLPRELVEHLGWPTDWQACMRHYTQLSRAEIACTFKRFCDARPAGGKFAHRATDGPAGSSPSMKWVNPPVAFMLHAGMPLLLQAGAHVPGMYGVDGSRVALEAYPGLAARAVLGRQSYKSDDAAKQSPERRAARVKLVDTLRSGEHPLALKLKVYEGVADQLADDPSGDSLDAVLCLMQAAWGWQRRLAGDALYGLRPGFDPLEGWIVTA